MKQRKPFTIDEWEHEVSGKHQWKSIELWLSKEAYIHLMTLSCLKTVTNFDNTFLQLSFLQLSFLPKNVQANLCDLVLS